MDAYGGGAQPLHVQDGAAAHHDEGAGVQGRGAQTQEVRGRVLRTACRARSREIAGESTVRP